MTTAEATADTIPPPAEAMGVTSHCAACTCVVMQVEGADELRAENARLRLRVMELEASRDASRMALKRALAAVAKSGDAIMGRLEAAMAEARR